jgi:S1-C subfamily serine protease
MNDSTAPQLPPAPQTPPLAQGEFTAEPFPAPAASSASAALAAPAASAAPAAPAASAAPAAPKSTRRRNTLLIVGGATAMALCIGGGGIVVGASIATLNNLAASSSAVTAEGSGLTTVPGSFRPSTGSGGYSQYGSGSTTTTTQSAATAATDEQKAGVVTIVSDLYYSDGSQAAGTGIILTSSGRILTNNHVIDGATSIEVTVESTGETYTADVVGYDSTDDIAVLQLVHASGLTPATLDDDTVSLADAVTSVGNAEGTGDLVAAAGTVTALDESITVGNESTGATESLTGLIEIDAAVVSGDSGGPLVDDEGEVVGVVTAASSGSATITGYAIPIETAMTIVQQIVAGDESGTVSIGLPAFLGVQLATAQTGAGVLLGGVIEGTAAATAGLAAGDTVTSVDGVAVLSTTELSSAIAAHEVGDEVVVGYTTAAGVASSVTVTLTEGPAA